MSQNKNDYQTPSGLIRSALAAKLLTRCAQHSSTRILDLGSGGGVWGATIQDYYKDKALNIHGVELKPEYQKHEAYTSWESCSIEDFNPDHKFHVVISNPPFSEWQAFVEKGISLLAGSMSWMMFLLPVSVFFAKKNIALWDKYKPISVNALIPRPSYTKILGSSQTANDRYVLVRWCSSRWNDSVAWSTLNWQYDKSDLMADHPNTEIYRELRNCS